MRVGDSLLKLLGLCLLAGVLVAGMLFPAVGALGVVSNRASDAIDSVSGNLVASDPALVTTVTDANGTPFAYLYDQYRIPVTADQISPTMKAALVAIEDRRFYEHNGVDWRGTMRAAVSNQTTGDVQGASTLTQQYVKNYLINVVYRGDEPEKKIEQKRAQEQTITRKLREARIAIQLEQKMTKDEILTGYLNIVEFAYQVYGVGAAAHAYFHTTPDKLTVPQAALLAGMVNNPSLYNPWQRPVEVLKRRNLVIDKMVETQKLSPDAAETYKKEALGVLPQPDKPAANCVGAGPEYGFFCQYVEDYLKKVGFNRDQLYAGGYVIKTSFDANATHLAKVAAEDQISKNSDGIANTMAIVRPGKDRHQVVALVSNRDYGLNKNGGETVYGLPYDTANKFGAGSIYKIFTAAAYLEKGGGIYQTIQTPPTHVSAVFKGGAPSCPNAPEPRTHWYCIKNAGDYGASMSLQDALAQSPNTGFVILEEATGMDLVVDMASRLGMRETMASNNGGRPPDANSANENERTSQSEFFRSKPNNPGNASFTLSPVATSTLELANVAATLMSGGTWCPPTPIIEVLDRNGKKVNVPEQACEQAVSEPLANTLVVGLSKDATSGTAARAANSFHWTRPMLGKTGTTQEHKSAGFVGATPQLAGAVLVFNDSPKPRPICDDPTRLCGTGNIFGGKTPAQTWFEAMGPIMAGMPVADLPQPDPRYLNGGDNTKVPNVVGKSQQEATQILQNSGYKVAARSRNDAAKKGTVVAQSPRGNALPGATITLQVSNGIAPAPSVPQQPDPGFPTGIPGFPGNGGGNGGGRGGGGGGGGGGPGEGAIILPNPP